MKLISEPGGYSGLQFGRHSGPYIEPRFTTSDRGQNQGHEGRRPIVMLSPKSEPVQIEVAGNSAPFHTLWLANVQTNEYHK